MPVRLHIAETIFYTDEHRAEKKTQIAYCEVVLLENNRVERNLGFQAANEDLCFG